VNRVLCFKPHLHVESTGDGKVFLLGEHERFLLEGRLHALVAPLIDGYRTEQEIIDALAHEASAPEVFYSLFTLERHGYVVEVRPERSREEAAFWYELGTDAARAAQRLQATPVAVDALPGQDAAPLIEALEGAGVALDQNAGVRVVLT
jgi:oxazoline/thiazoline synthase